MLKCNGNLICMKTKNFYINNYFEDAIDNSDVNSVFDAVWITHFVDNLNEFRWILKNESCKVSGSNVLCRLMLINVFVMELNVELLICNIKVGFLFQK